MMTLDPRTLIKLNQISAKLTQPPMHLLARSRTHSPRGFAPCRAAGWSYGGYLSAMCLAKAPEVFRCAVSGAPVTSWDGYDTHYTERYMGLPEENEEGYRDGSVMEHASKIEGRLMLVHGCLDENVHFRHTARLVTALIHARKTYQLLAFPDERHLPRGHADRVYMEERIEAFLTAL